MYDPVSDLSNTFLVPNLKPAFKKVSDVVTQVSDNVVSSNESSILALRTASERMADEMKAMAASIIPALGFLKSTSITKLLKDAQKKVPIVIDQLRSDPLLGYVVATIGNAPGFGSTEDGRFFWICHIFALAQGESGPGMVNNLESSGKTKVQGKELPFHTYGLLQHTPDNWEWNSMQFAKSPIGKFFNDSGLANKVVNQYGIYKDWLMNPFDKYGKQYMPILQLAPILHQFQLMKDFIDKNFMFTESIGWMPVKKTATFNPFWLYLYKEYGAALKTYLSGRQILLTLCHINGTEWMKLTPPGSHANRIVKDVKSFVSLSQNVDFHKAVVTTLRTFAGFFSGLSYKGVPSGDPDTDKDQVTTSSGVIVYKTKSDEHPVITSPFYSGKRTVIIKGKPVTTNHRAVDIKAKSGTEIFAPEAGTVFTR